MRNGEICIGRPEYCFFPSPFKSRFIIDLLVGWSVSTPLRGEIVNGFYCYGFMGFLFERSF